MIEHNWKFLHHNHVWQADYCDRCGLESFFCSESNERYYYLQQKNCILSDARTYISCEEWIIKSIIE